MHARTIKYGGITRFRLKFKRHGKAVKPEKRNDKWINLYRNSENFEQSCNTVKWSIKTYIGQIHRLPYIATVNNFPWAALPID